LTSPGGKNHQAHQRDPLKSKRAKSRSSSKPKPPARKPKTQSKQQPDPSKYAVDQKAPVPIPRTSGPCLTTQSAARVSLPIQQCQTAGSCRNRAQAIRRAFLPASPLKKKQKSGQALY